MKKIVSAAVFGLFAAQAGADSLQIQEIPLTGSPTGGYHTIEISGAKCKLKSSAMTHASPGCNYLLMIPGIETGGVLAKGPIQVRNRTNPACSISCE